MKFVNLDESEIIEQPLEKVIARPDYSPIEFGYDNLCSLDSVSVDGIHPSGDDSDLILPPSVNKINSCFKSEYFKISNLFSEIQTYEQKQEALKNLGLLGAINNSTYIHDLGRFDKQVDVEEAAVKVANNSNVVIMLYYIGSQNGIILQQVGDTITKQILLWDNTIFQRHVNFSDSSKTQVSSISYWWKLGATHISYDPDTRKFHLQDMNYNNLNPTVDSKVPLASSTEDGFMSKEQAQKLEVSLSIKDLGTNIQPHVATGNIITYVKDNNIKETVLFKYIDTDGSSTLGVCISRINDIGWIIYLVARKGIERLVFNSNGVREEWNEYGGVLRHNLDSVADEQLECLSVKGVKSLLSTKQDALSPGDGITMMNNTVSTLIGNGLTYNGREIVIDHDLTLKTNNGKLGVNAGDGLYVNPDNELGINVGKGLTINHTDSTVEVAKEVLEEIDSKAPLEGYAPNLKVRFSDGLVGRIETIPHEIGKIAPTAGISVDDNNATIERIKGESVVWNQLLNNKSLPNTGVYNDVELTNNNNGTFTVNGTPLSSLASILINFGIQKHGHKYLCEGIPSRNAVTEAFFRIHYIEDGNNNPLKTVDETGNCFFSLSTTIDVELRCYFYIRPNYTVTNETYAPKLYDLTLMFGAGNEPTTIEEFEARKPLGVTNDYNEGTIVSFQGGDIKSVGFNAFTAKTSEEGSINTTTGLNMPLDTAKRSDFLPCIGNVQYEFIKALHLYEYDTNRNFIKHTHLGNAVDQPINKIITLHDKTHYIRVVYPSKNESGVCIHLVHSGYRNGDYEPYVEDIRPLPDIKSIKDSNGDVLFPYGLLSAGSVHDEITATKAIKRIVAIDMGAWNWSYDTTHSGFILSGISIRPVTKDFSQMLCVKYPYKGSYNNVNDKELGYIFNNRPFVKDSSYTSVGDFKQAMSGVLLYYELAEPIEVDLEEPLNMTYDAWDFGTEELVVSEPSTSLKGEIIYHFNAVDRIRDNSRAIETLKEHVEERKDDGIELLTNGNLKLTLKGETREFMPATPSGDPMHYAYETAGAEYNATTDFIIKNAPWKDMVDTIEDKAKWGFDIVDANQVKQMTINGTVYNYVQTTRQSPDGTTQSRYFLVGQASDGTWVEDETKVLHLPGHWYLNGLGDITDKEIKRIWQSPHAGTAYTFINCRARTIIHPGLTSSVSIDATSMFAGSSIETIVMNEVYFSNMYLSFYSCKKLKHVTGSWTVPKLTRSMFTYNKNDIFNIRSLKCRRVKESQDLQNIPYLSKPSIIYMIDNAVLTSAITITLHADRYSQLAEDADIISALEAKNTALAGTGGSISLVSA